MPLLETNLYPERAMFLAAFVRLSRRVNRPGWLRPGQDAPEFQSQFEQTYFWAFGWLTPGTLEAH